MISKVSLTELNIGIVVILLIGFCIVSYCESMTRNGLIVVPSRIVKTATWTLSATPFEEGNSPVFLDRK